MVAGGELVEASQTSTYPSYGVTIKHVCVNFATWSVTVRHNRGALLPTVVTAIPEPRSMSELPSTSRRTPPPAAATNTGRVVPTPSATCAVRIQPRGGPGPGMAVTRRRSCGRVGPPRRSRSWAQSGPGGGAANTGGATDRRPETADAAESVAPSHCPQHPIPCASRGRITGQDGRSRTSGGEHAARDVVIWPATGSIGTQALAVRRAASRPVPRGWTSAAGGSPTRPAPGRRADRGSAQPRLFRRQVRSSPQRSRARRRGLRRSRGAGPATWC